MPTKRLDQRDVTLACSSVVVIAPLVVDPGALDPYLPLRFLLVGAALLVALLSMLASIGAPEMLREVPPALVSTWTGLAVVASVAAFGAPLPLESFLGDSARRGGALTVALLFAAFLLGVHVRDRLPVLLRLSPAAIIVVAVAMAWRASTGSLADARAVLVGNAGQLGAYLVLLLGMAAVVARADADRRWRRVAVAALPLGAASLLLTGSHAAAIGAAALVGAWLVSGDLASTHRAVRGAMALSAAGVLVVAVLWTERFRVLADSMQGRIATWSVAWDAVAARPWLGWGPDGFRHGFAAHVPAAFVRSYGDDRITDRAHTIVLEPLVSMGVVGALATMLVLTLYVRYREREDAVARGTSRALFAVGIFLLAWFPEVEIAVIIALLAGATLRSFHCDRDRLQGRPRAIDRGTSHLLAVLLVGVTLSSVGVAIGGVVTDRQVVEQLEALSGGSEQTANPVLPAASPMSGVSALLVAVPAMRSFAEPPGLRAARDAVEEPRDAERTTLHAELSGALARRTGDPVELRRAADTYRHALALAPNHSVAWSGLGEVLLLAGDPAAQAALERAADLRPSDVAPRANLALLAVSRGDAVTAAGFLRSACERAPDDQQLLGLITGLGWEPREYGCAPSE